MILVCPNCTSRFKVKAEAIGDAGRQVRCAKCGHKWHATQEDLIDPSDLQSLSKAAAPAKKAAPKKAKPAKAPPPPPPPEDFDDEDPPGQDEPGDDGYEEAAAPPPPPPMMDDTEPPPLPREEDFVPRRTVPTKRRSPLIAWVVLLVFITLGSLTAFVFRTDIVTAYLPANKIFSWVGFPVDLLGHGLEISKPKTEAIIGSGNRRLEISGTIENSTSETITIPRMAATLEDATGLELEVWIFAADKVEAFPGKSVTYQTSFENTPKGATKVSITFKTEEEAVMIESGEKPVADPPEDN